MAEEKEENEIGDEWLWLIGIIVFLFVAVLGFSKPFNPTFINLEYFFSKLVPAFEVVRDFFSNGRTWYVIRLVSSLLSILMFGVIIYSLIRMREIQNDEKREINEEINESLAKEKEKEREENPRWRYIQTLLESPNNSDWRVAVIEADSMLDEVLTERGYEGDTVGEKLKNAKFSSVQNAWGGHKVRNEIAHQGMEAKLSQNEARRAVKMFQSVFEELNVI
ncbi:MAG: hypothetical protein U9R00_03020 [Patescibacteria group bacterium]|nr:hypothetical protein [Patescibacteria group bacterium]